MKNPFIAILIVSIILFIRCETTTEQITPIINEYVTLNVGDIHQYKTDFDSTTYFEWEVIGKTKRSDNLEVYVIKNSIIIDGTTFVGEVYQYLNDEYLVGTKLEIIDSLNDIAKNPFHEILLAKINPINGDYFQTNVNINEEAEHSKIDFINIFKTYAKNFNNVMRYTITNKSLTRNFQTYYTKRYGQIGTTIYNQNDTIGIYATYCKSNAKEIGVYVDFESNYNKIVLKNQMAILPYLYDHSNNFIENK